MVKKKKKRVLGRGEKLREKFENTKLLTLKMEERA